MKIKIISLLILISFLTGCTAVTVDDGVVRDEQGNSIIDNTTGQIQTSIARNELGYDAWGRPKIVNDFTMFHGLWTYDVPYTMWLELENGTEQLNGSDLVVSTNGMLEVKPYGEAQSKRHPRYQPNRGMLYSTAVILPNHLEDGVREFGMFNDENGYFFRLENGTLNAVRRTTVSGVTTDYSNTIPLPAGLNLSRGNIYDIQAQWRGVGNIKFFINLELVYTMNLLGTMESLSSSNPALPVTFKTVSGTNSLFAGCVDVTSEGGAKENRQYNSLTSGEQSLTTAETALVVLKVNETFNGKLNTRDLALRRISGYADDNTLIRIYFTRDPSAITGGTWLPYNGGNVLYQITPTFTQTALTKQLVEGRIPAFGDYSIDNPDEDFGDFYATAGDYVIVTLEAKANTDGGVVVEWGEEI